MITLTTTTVTGSDLAVCEIAARLSGRWSDSVELSADYLRSVYAHVLRTAGAVTLVCQATATGCGVVAESTPAGALVELAGAAGLVAA